MTPVDVVPRVSAGRLVIGISIGESWPQQDYVTTILLLWQGLAGRGGSPGPQETQAQGPQARQAEAAPTRGHREEAGGHARQGRGVQGPHTLQSKMCIQGLDCSARAGRILLHKNPV